MKNLMPNICDVFVKSIIIEPNIHGIEGKVALINNNSCPVINFLTEAMAASMSEKDKEFIGQVLQVCLIIDGRSYLVEADIKGAWNMSPVNVVEGELK